MAACFWICGISVANASLNDFLRFANSLLNSQALIRLRAQFPYAPARITTWEACEPTNGAKRTLAACTPPASALVSACTGRIDWAAIRYWKRLYSAGGQDFAHPTMPPPLPRR